MDLFLRQLCISCVVLVLSVGTSCTTERTVLGESKVKSKSSGNNNLEDKLTSSFTYEKGEDGQMRMKSNKTNEFAGKSFTGAQSKENKSFNVDQYSTKKWEGKKDYSAKAFDGRDKDAFKDTPYFVTKQAEAQNRIFDERKDFNVKDADVSGESWAQAGRQVERKVDSKTLKTPEVEVPVTEFRDYAKKTVEETNAMLGRKKVTE